jgi:hypothetical protein
VYGSRHAWHPQSHLILLKDRYTDPSDTPSGVHVRYGAEDPEGSPSDKPVSPPQIKSWNLTCVQKG